MRDVKYESLSERAIEELISRRRSDEFASESLISLKDVRTRIRKIEGRRKKEMKPDSGIKNTSLIAEYIFRENELKIYFYTTKFKRVCRYYNNIYKKSLCNSKIGI